MSNILMVVTAADSLTLADGSAHPTGFWAEELVVAHRDLTAAGHTITVATPGGRIPTVDPGSLTVEIVGDQAKVDDFRAYLSGIADDLAHPLALDSAVAADYDAVVLPGGHGPMADLAFDVALGSLLTEADARGTMIAPFCHGPAGLLSAVDTSGAFTFAGRRLTVFTDDEERTGGLGENTPWFVASTLRKRGALVEDGDAWSSHVVRDGNLISGQNPQSSEAVAKALVEALAS
ncbi:Putative intracellular protease/amidase [Leifsonia sp. 98AMF]|uniref:type 1 glutamine amidotransferase domain-containing protein n=1 Tax=unclassified Leifsonia TaxID=2663824 RepID=UPI000879AA72|nr:MULTISPECIES: type 1 glutamine amidotransferase domain-containing protein [unclassified Leifsonia]SDH09756.1 Putative intracellular protease/amidase [Leifsonia sp. 197AMF]SDJ29490.1 Putative intracellular protease/amidase [Leifsonia sp. 466MF]SDK51066.1 Putative intracellular protease/amidase [Leifsonia sp. 157MF]SDN51298.1 Putative intracellular protease/amidase [Leifsonia sp. 509MF]SEN58923.1 Putative intracellular protease/amidase [Leifsonia sp. 467MF]